MAFAAAIRRFFEALSRPPVHTWPDAVQHHAARIIILLFLATATYILFPAVPVPNFPVLEKGMVVDEDIIAEIGFPINKTEPELRRQQDEAAASIAPILRYDSAAVDTMRARVATFHARLDSAFDASVPPAEAAGRQLQTLRMYQLPAREDIIGLLRSKQNRDALWRSLQATVAQEVARGVAESTSIDGSVSPQVRVIRGEDSDRLVSRDSVLVEQRLRDRAVNHLPANAPAGLAEFQRLALLPLFVPSLRFDRASTELTRMGARQAVPLQKGNVIQGERVIAAHEQIQDEDIERLRAYQSALAAQGKLEPGAFHISHIAGTITLNLIFLSIFGFMLLFYRPAVYRSFRHILLLSALYFGVTSAAAVMAGANAPDSLVPIAFPVLVVAVLWDGRMALTLALVIAILLSTQPPFGGLSPRVLLVAGGAAAALSVRVVRRRAEGLILGAVIAGAYAIASLGLGMLLSWNVLLVAQSAAWGAVNGVASALLAMGLMPLFEAFTKITTDQTLLELTDMNRPLLKRLSLEASGTYAHSINVANLAEAAARVVDANALLARVGAYYHDIGKMATPQYFIENQARGRNPHDRLDPATSAAIVRGHVLEGIRMADQANLPETVRAFIPEHHGTQAIGFFFDQARQAQPDADLNPTDYAYPGPRPRSKETAITMLADSVESAAKVLQEPTPERIRALVDRIVDAKVSRGQLDESPLTFEDVARIKEQFAVVLTGMYHHRIDYPPAPAPASEPASSGAGQASA